MTTTEILDQLKQVTDPHTGGDIVSRSMVEELRIDGNNVNFTLVLPSLSSEHKQELNFACMRVIQDKFPSANVNLHLTARAPGAAATASVLPQVKNIIAVGSGKGGVGKSTVSTNLALALKELGARVGLIDADLHGPSIPTMFGMQGQRPKMKDVYGKPRLEPLERYGMPVMSIGFIIEADHAVVLRGPRLAGILKQFLTDTIWPDLDYLVIDLPPGTGDIQLSLVQTVPVTGAVLVTTPQEVAVADAIKAMNMFRLPNINIPIVGVVENMSWFTPAELPNNKYYLFGQGGGKQLTRQAGSVLLGQIPLVQGIREAGDAGKPIVLQENHAGREAFMAVARKLVAQVNLRNEMLGPTQRVQVS